jgi:UDP-N-acetylmuramoylalanine--D-glutamate ligase
MQVLVVGAARQGTALARYLATHGANVILNDSRKPSQLQEARANLAGLPIGWVLGAHPVRLLEGADLVCPSGGVPLELPLIAEARRRGIPLSNDTQIFLDLAPCPVIGITGSAGKTTTTTLVGRIAQAAVDRGSPVRAAWVGGNLGNPLIDVLDEMRRDDLAILELSSFQLDLVARSPHIAAILNITPNHLDRHGSMAAYTAAKANILKYQHASDLAILNRDDPGAWSLAGEVKGRLITFGVTPPGGNGSDSLPGEGSPRGLDVHPEADHIVLQDGSAKTTILPAAEILLRGAHNLQNVLAACAIAAAAGLPVEAMRAGVAGFTGVPHRLEFVRQWRGSHWYNDSIATAPERTLAGLRAFDAPLVLLAGGRDKDLPWDDFAAQVAGRVDHLVAFGATAEMIAGKVRAVPGAALTVDTAPGLREAVEIAARRAAAGDVVLLSPGGTSFDEFTDFAERGERFKQWVLDLP